jgi:hypothetical protein
VSEPQWWFSLRGEVTAEVVAALERAGLALTGLSHSLGFDSPPSEQSHSVLVRAPTAEDALGRAHAAVEGLAVYVRDDTLKPFDVEDPSS